MEYGGIFQILLDLLCGVKKRTSSREGDRERERGNLFFCLLPVLPVLLSPRLSMQICLLYSVIYFKKFVRLIWPGVGSKLEQGNRMGLGFCS